MNMRGAGAFLLVLGLCAGVSGSQAQRQDAQEGVITVDPAKTYQTMRGWEVSAHLYEQNKQLNRYDPSWLAVRTELLDRLVNEVGVDRIRIEIRSGAENPVDYWRKFETGEISYEEAKEYRYQNINDNDDPNVVNPAGFQFSELDYRVENVVLPMKRLVEANGEKLYVNLIYVDFSRHTKHRGNLSHARRPDEYAELILATFTHLRDKYALVPDALEVVLEPENSLEWGGAEIGVAMVAADRRLRKAGFSPDYIAPSTSAARLAPQFIDRMMAIQGVAGLVKTFAYHRYDTVLKQSTLEQIGMRAIRYRVETAMLEHLTGDAAELHSDLTQVNVSSWQQYGIAYRDLPDRDRQGGYLFLVDDAARRIRMSSRTPGLAQYFKFIRAGAVRIGATSSRVDDKAVAFRNANGTHVVVVQAKQAGTLAIRGLPAGTYGVRYSTAKETARELPPVTVSAGAPLVEKVPSESTVTFYQRPMRPQTARSQ
jgi:hypothetical protein